MGGSICDWVKIPQISNNPKETYKVQTIASFADIPSLSQSDLLSSVFSFDRPLVTFKIGTTSRPSTTSADPPVITSFIKEQILPQRVPPSTVTSKTVEFVDEISDRIDHNVVSMTPVRLLPPGVITRHHEFDMPASNEYQKVTYMNQTVPLYVVPEYDNNEANGDVHNDDDYDGVTILNEDEDLSSSEEGALSEEEYYEYEEPVAPPSSTTTRTPPKKTLTRKPTTKSPRKSPTKPNRRVMKVETNKAKVHNHLSFTNFLKFMKNIQQTFTTRTAKNINEKIKMLRQFRDNLLLSINQRIKSLWKIKKEPRVKRTLSSGGGGGWMEQQSHGGGGMDFPSAEGALLSISFLTFAVFLIKLVLVSADERLVKLFESENFLNFQQVIQAIKMKKYGYGNGVNVENMQTSNVIIKRTRNARDVSYQHPNDFIFTPQFLNDNFYISPRTDLHQNIVKNLL